MKHIDRLIQKIEDSKLSEDRKQMLICILRWIRSVMEAVRRFFKGLYDFLRTHKHLTKAAIVGLLLAIAVSHIGVIGPALAFMIMCFAICYGLIREFDEGFRTLFDPITE
jgi:uncharacterized membrane protein